MFTTFATIQESRALKLTVFDYVGLNLAHLIF